jgi:hypothetical protein
VLPNSFVQPFVENEILRILVLGIALDARGDIAESPVTVLRVARGGSSSRILSVEGGVVDRGVRPSGRLVAAAG